MTAPAAGLRIGDTERAAAADRLAWHFSRGRLDQVELDERLGRAMRATTAGELTELLADLPAEGPVPSAAGQLRPADAGRKRPARAPRRHGLAFVVLAVCIIAGAALMLRALTHSIAALAVILLIAVLWLRRRRFRG